MFTIQFGDYTFPNQTFIPVGIPLNNLTKETNVPRAHGAVMPTFYLKSRKIAIRGILHNADSDANLTALLNMQQALLNGEQALYLRSDRYIKARLFDFDDNRVDGSDGRIIECDISMKAANPFFYSAGASYSVGVTVSGTTISFSVYNGGNVYSEPKISIYASGATISDNIKLYNQTDNNTFFRYRGTLPAGQTLSLDSESLAVLLNGVDGLSDFEGSFLNVLGGTNTFQFIGSDCRVTVDYKYRWID